MRLRKGDVDAYDTGIGRHYTGTVKQQLLRALQHCYAEQSTAQHCKLERSRAEQDRAQHNGAEVRAQYSRSEYSTAGDSSWFL